MCCTSSTVTTFRRNGGIPCSLSNISEQQKSERIQQNLSVKASQWFKHTKLPRLAMQQFADSAIK